MYCDFGSLGVTVLTHETTNRGIIQARVCGNWSDGCDLYNVTEGAMLSGTVHCFLVNVPSTLVKPEIIHTYLNSNQLSTRNC